MIAILAAVAGLAAGALAGAASWRLRERRGPWSWRRQAALALSGAAIGAWSCVVHDGALGAVGALLGWQLLLLALLDAEQLWLPRMLTLPLIGSGLAIAGATGLAELVHRGLGAAVGFLGLALLGLAYRRLRGREGLGGGDAYLLAGGGAWVGWMGLPTILIWAAGGGLAYALVRALVRRPVRQDEQIPFGVFLGLGTWLTWLYGPLGG